MEFFDVRITGPPIQPQSMVLIERQEILPFGLWVEANPKEIFGTITISTLRYQYISSGSKPWITGDWNRWWWLVGTSATSAQ